MTLSGSSTQTIAFGATFSDAGATFSDGLDGTGIITTASSGTVNSSVAGAYTLQYWKVDAAGNTSNTVTRTVTVSAQVSAGGGGGGGSSSSSLPTTTTTTTSSGTVTNSGTVTESGSISSTPINKDESNLQKELNVKKNSIISAKTILKKGAQVNVFRILPNGKMVKVGTTRVLANGKIQFKVPVAGKYKFVQK